MKQVYFKLINKWEAFETCDTGWGQNKITPQECEQRLEGTEIDIEVIKKDIEMLELELNDLKLKILKEICIKNC